MATVQRQSVRKFTAKSIRALKFPEDSKSKQVYISVEPAVNLYLSLTRSGTKSFCYRKKLGGNWKSLDLGIKFVDSLDDTACRLAIQAAQASASELTGKVSRGVNPFLEAKAQKEDPTLQDIFNLYKAGHLEKRAKQVLETEKQFDRWFGKVAKRKASSFTYQDAYRLHEQMNDSPYAANRALQLGRAFFNFALKTQLIRGDNPFVGVTLNKEIPRERFLSHEEGVRLLAAVTNPDIPENHCTERSLADFILLLMSLGVRKSNLLCMRWDEIDTETWVWSIPAENMKNGRAKSIRFSTSEAALLERRKAILTEAGFDSPWVFPSSTSATGHTVDFKKAWDSLRKQLELPDLTLHDLRRSLASSMINSGVDASIVQRALSHADPRTTAKHYIRTTELAELDARQTALKPLYDGAKTLREKG